MNYKKLLLITLSVFSIQFCVAQFTAVPDPVFEQYLLDEGIDTDGTINGQFLTANAIGVVFLDFDNLLIENLTGIEVFIDIERVDARNTNIAEADFSYNIVLDQLTFTDGPLHTIDLSQNINLHTLFIDNCQISNINITNNINLVNISLIGNHLSNINLTNNTNAFVVWLNENDFTNIDIPLLPELKGLHLKNNQLTNIDLSNVTELITLRINDNQLTSLDLSNNSFLELLSCTNNQLTELDVTNNPLIEIINCSHNQISNVVFGETNFLREFSSDGNFLTDIDLSNMPSLEVLGIINSLLTSIDVSQCPNLRRLICYNNQITTPLDLTQNPLLEWLYCQDNPIPSIDLTLCPNLEICSLSNTHLSSLDLSNNILSDTAAMLDMPFLEWVDVRNNNNENIFFISLNSPNLTCVYVNDASSGDGDFTIDAHTTLVNNELECEALSIEDFLLTTIAVYPNPVNTTLFINNNSNIQIETIKVYDVLGRLVIQEKENFNSIDVTHINSGLLFVQIETEQGIITKKLVKN